MTNVNDKIQTGQVGKQHSNTNEYFEYNFSKVTYHHQQSHDLLLQERVRIDGHPQLWRRKNLSRGSTVSRPSAETVEIAWVERRVALTGEQQAVC